MDKTIDVTQNPTGVFPEYRSFEIKLRIAEDNNGGLYSTHAFTSPEDEQTADSLPSHGLEQIVMGLLTETLRREAYLEVIVLCHEHDGYLQKYVNAPPEIQEERRKQIAANVTLQMHKLIGKMAPDIVPDVMAMISEQLPSSSSQPSDNHQEDSSSGFSPDEA